MKRTAVLLIKFFDRHLVAYKKSLKDGEFQLVDKSPQADPRDEWSKKVLVVSEKMYNTMVKGGSKNG